MNHRLFLIAIVLFISGCAITIEVRPMNGFESNCLESDTLSPLCKRDLEFAATSGNYRALGNHLLHLGMAQSLKTERQRLAQLGLWLNPTPALPQAHLDPDLASITVPSIPTGDTLRFGVGESAPQADHVPLALAGNSNTISTDYLAALIGNALGKTVQYSAQECEGERFSPPTPTLSSLGSYSPLASCSSTLSNRIHAAETSLQQGMAWEAKRHIELAREREEGPETLRVLEKNISLFSQVHQSEEKPSLARLVAFLYPQQPTERLVGSDGRIRGSVLRLVTHALNDSSLTWAHRALAHEAFLEAESSWEKHRLTPLCVPFSNAISREIEEDQSPNADARNVNRLMTSLPALSHCPYDNVLENTLAGALTASIQRADKVAAKLTIQLVFDALFTQREPWLFNRINKAMVTAIQETTAAQENIAPTLQTLLEGAELIIGGTTEGPGPVLEGLAWTERALQKDTSGQETDELSILRPAFQSGVLLLRALIKGRQGETFAMQQLLDRLESLLEQTPHPWEPLEPLVELPLAPYSSAIVGLLGTMGDTDPSSHTLTRSRILRACPLPAPTMEDGLVCTLLWDALANVRAESKGVNPLIHAFAHAKEISNESPMPRLAGIHRLILALRTPSYDQDFRVGPDLGPVLAALPAGSDRPLQAILSSSLSKKEVLFVGEIVASSVWESPLPENLVQHLLSPLLSGKTIPWEKVRDLFEDPAPSHALSPLYTGILLHPETPASLRNWLYPKWLATDKMETSIACQYSLPIPPLNWTGKLSIAWSDLLVHQMDGLQTSRKIGLDGHGTHRERLSCEKKETPRLDLQIEVEAVMAAHAFAQNRPEQAHEHLLKAIHLGALLLPTATAFSDPTKLNASLEGQKHVSLGPLAWVSFLARSEGQVHVAQELEELVRLLAPAKESPIALGTLPKNFPKEWASAAPAVEAWYFDPNAPDDEAQLLERLDTWLQETPSSKKKWVRTLLLAVRHATAGRLEDTKKWRLTAPKEDPKQSLSNAWSLVASFATDGVAPSKETIHSIFEGLANTGMDGEISGLGTLLSNMLAQQAKTPEAVSVLQNAYAHMDPTTAPLHHASVFRTLLFMGSPPVSDEFLGQALRPVITATAGRTKLREEVQLRLMEAKLFATNNQIAKLHQALVPVLRLTSNRPNVPIYIWSIRALTLATQPTVVSEDIDALLLRMPKDELLEPTRAFLTSFRDGNEQERTESLTSFLPTLFGT